MPECIGNQLINSDLVADLATNILVETDFYLKGYKVPNSPYHNRSCNYSPGESYRVQLDNVACDVVCGPCVDRQKIVDRNIDVTVQCPLAARVCIDPAKFGRAVSKNRGILKEFVEPATQQMALAFNRHKMYKS